MSKKDKLIYFNGRGRAEVIRLVYAAAGVEYEDKRVQGEEWSKLKDNTPTGKLPVLEVDGKMLPDSMAIARYVAKKHGLYGKDERWGENATDAIIGICGDAISEHIKVFFEKDAGKKAELQAKFTTEVLPKLMKSLERMMNENGKNGFFVGDKLSLADIVVYDLCSNLSASNKLTPPIQAHMEKIGAIPNIKAWIDKRPDTSF